MLTHLEYCERLGPEVERFATVLEDCPTGAPVPPCPAWSVGDLAQHLGMVQRWAAGLVERRAPARLGFRALGLVEEPPTPQWMRAGGEALIAVLRATDPDAPMWAWGADQHVRFWSRRQLHETMVHRVDLELAAGAATQLDAELAADGVDELLENLPAAESFSPNVAELRGSGERLSLVAEDTASAWLVVFEPSGFRVERASGEAVPAADATVRGPAAELLLTCYRRTPLDLNGLAVEGDGGLARFWFDSCALQ